MRKNPLTGAIFFFIFLLLASGIGLLSSQTVNPGFGKGTEEYFNDSQSQSGGTQGVKLDPKLTEKLKKCRLFLNAQMKQWEVPGMGVGAVKNGQVILAEGFGYRNLAQKLPVTPNTLFAIGSATKAFTTMGLGLLVEEGKIEWDKPVRQYLPEFKLRDEIATERLTVRDFVCHRSGLPRHEALWYGSSFSRKDIVKRLRYLNFSADIRSTFQYNNLMFLTAGYLIEKLTNSSWEEFTRQRIFEPLGMKSSNFSVTDTQKTDDYALPYVLKDKAVIEVPFRNVDTIGPAGSINSNVIDMLKWVRFHLDKGKVGNTKKCTHRQCSCENLFFLSSRIDNQLWVTDSDGSWRPTEATWSLIMEER
ncbi:MAG: serine hydrolase domain-containing protein [Candidatus Aminicenantales bacterium]